MSNELYLNDTQLNDPINDLQDGIVDPSKVEEQTPPGFFQTLRNPMELIFEESLPASLYQYATGNTKKVQAERALKFLQQYPQLQNTGQYKEAERIYKKFGYLLEDGEQSFDAGEILKMAKKYPSVIGGELVNMLLADPYLLLLPATLFSRLGRGIVNSSRLKFSDKFKRLPKRVKATMAAEAKRDMKVGAMASTLLPFAFSTGLQLGESGQIDGKRLTVETTLGATAGLIISAGLGGLSAMTNRLTYVNQPTINQAIINRINKYKSPDEALSFTNNGFYKITDDIIEKDLKNNIKDFTPSKINAIKAEIDTAIRDSLENGRDSIKSSLVKAGTFGAIGATAQFLTEEDDKVVESIKGFGTGVAAYALIKGANKLFFSSRKLSPIELDFERTADAIKMQYHKLDSMATRISIELKNLLPDASDRIKVFHNINKTKVDNNLQYNKSGRIITDSELANSLNGKELLEAKRILKKYFDTMYSSLTSELDDLNFIINYRSSYTPLIFQGYTSKTTAEFAQRIFGSPQKSSRFFKERIFDNINDALEAGQLLKNGMDDPAKLIQVYTSAAAKALANRNLVYYLKNHRYVFGKNELGSPLSQNIMYNRKDFFRINEHSKPYYKEFRHPLLDNNDSYFVHQDMIKSLNMLFEAKDPNEFMGALFNTNLMMKRSAVGFSFFHAGALIESMFFAGVPFKIIKEFLKPRSKNQIMQMIENPNITLKNFTYATEASEKLGYKDLVSFARAARLEISTPEDVGYDRFYAIMQRIDNDVLKPHFGIKPMAKVEKVYKWFDRITWDKIFSQAKIYTFLRQLDKIVKPGDTQGVIYYKARQAAQFTNDAFGGQNWEAITQSIVNPTYKRLTQTLFKPSSRGYMQLLFFAPDWTLSNARIIGKGLPGFTSDPTTRRMYQYYFLRAALMFGTVGTALNYTFSGKSQLENKDPTRIDLGDGQVLTFSKQLMEPFHWITDPQGTGIKKIGSLPKAVIEILTNKEYLTTKWSPNITTKDDNAIEKFYKIGGQIGEKFLPIWLLQSTKTIKEKLENEGLSSDLAINVAVDFVLGQSGHPRYKGPRTSQYKLSGLVRSPYETLF
jgi:hypothetical protein